MTSRNTPTRQQITTSVPQTDRHPHGIAGPRAPHDGAVATGTTIGRRDFLRTSTAALGTTAWAFAAGASAADTAERPVRVGVMGLSRGRQLAYVFAQQPHVTVKYVCDVDENRANAAAQFLKSRGFETTPIRDFRRILDDPQIDALVCAAPNHWHGPATILACKAGKHVYVEKPCSHNPQEGEWMVQAARKYKRCVQMGTQRRSGPGTRLAIQKLREGIIGRVYLSRSWYNNVRGPIGHGKPAPVPPNLDYDLWQGPAPRVPYYDNRIHYNWHWFWHWGNGELGNNGVHSIDLSRWGLGVDYPVRVTSSGGRYRYDDDQQTPDTHTVCFEFPGECQIVWEGLSCNRHRIGWVAFYGENGALELDSNGTHRVYDARDKLVDEYKTNRLGEPEHVQNFLQAVRADDPSLLNQEIEEGHKSTLLCHLGNIAHRTGHTLECDPANGHIRNDDQAMALWRREYEPGWEPQV
ncbi:MAG: gfo/Idh/MocA family oxidoreductase [Planctomycetota bacterium]|nr:MAG: gfo/Idh/MocA family oxidoreductase [Planctomycetota bacterium]